MSFLEKLKKGVGIKDESVNQEDFEEEEDKSSSSPFATAREVEGLEKPTQPKKQAKKSKKIKLEESKLSSSPFVKAREGKETSSLLPPRSAREAEEKFVAPQEEIPKKAVDELRSSSPFANARVTEEIKTEDKKWPEPEGQLAIDVYQTDGELVIQSTIAGIKPEDLDITVQEDTVIIRGKREKIGTEEKNYFYQECYWGPFSREIILPVEADASRAEASMKEGVLTIRIPKIVREKKKKIIVK